MKALIALPFIVLTVIALGLLGVSALPEKPDPQATPYRNLMPNESLNEIREDIHWLRLYFERQEAKKP